METLISCIILISPFFKWKKIKLREKPSIRVTNLFSTYFAPAPGCSLQIQGHRGQGVCTQGPTVPQRKHSGKLSAPKREARGVAATTDFRVLSFSVYSGHKSFVRQVVCQHFLVGCDLFLNCVFSRVDVLNFDEVQFTNIFFYEFRFGHCN